MRKNINYNANENVRTMRAYIIDCMVEDDIRDYDNDFVLECGASQIRKSDVKAAYVEDILESYEELTRDFRYDDGFESYEYVEESFYFEKYYGYEIA